MKILTMTLSVFAFFVSSGIVNTAHGISKPAEKKETQSFFCVGENPNEFYSKAGDVYEKNKSKYREIEFGINEAYWKMMRATAKKADAKTVRKLKDELYLHYGYYADLDEKTGMTKLYDKYNVDQTCLLFNGFDDKFFEKYWNVYEKHQKEYDTILPQLNKAYEDLVKVLMDEKATKESQKAAYEKAKKIETKLDELNKKTGLTEIFKNQFMVVNEKDFETVDKELKKSIESEFGDYKKEEERYKILFDKLGKDADEIMKKIEKIEKEAKEGKEKDAEKKIAEEIKKIEAIEKNAKELENKAKQEEKTWWNSFSDWFNKW